MIDEYTEKNDWQIRLRDRYIKPFYEQTCKDAKYVFVDGNARPDTCSYYLQKNVGMDTFAMTSKGTSSAIDEKIDKHYGSPNFMIETESCTVEGHKKEGWIYYSLIDLLFYAFVLPEEKGLDLYIIHFRPFQTWFIQTWMPANGNNIKKNHIMPDTLNHTKCMKVPIREVTRAMRNTRRFLITRNGIQLLNTETSIFELDKMLKNLDLGSCPNVLEATQSEQVQEAQIPAKKTAKKKKTPIPSGQLSIWETSA